LQTLAENVNDTHSAYSLDNFDPLPLNYYQMIHRFSQLMSLLMNYNDCRRTDLCKDIIHLAAANSSFEYFGLLVFQFLLSDSFNSLALSTHPTLLTAEESESSTINIATMPASTSRIAIYDDLAGVSHLIDDGIFSYDFYPVKGSVIYARSSIVYYLCSILDYNEREVLVKWDTDGMTCQHISRSLIQVTSI
jgi:hypothetical protein